jgi:hypothetical protein
MVPMEKNYMKEDLLAWFANSLSYKTDLKIIVENNAIFL